MKTSDQIIQNFIDTGYKHMANIPNNKVFLTDNSCSTLVWVEDTVVIEYYFLFPNLETPLHSHPFNNKMIFISGELTAYRKTPNIITVEGNWLPDMTYTKTFTDLDANYLSSNMPIGFEHGFTVGDKGAVIYNIQVWPESVKNPLSAAVEYFGTSMGPIHEKLISEIKSN
jgi:hypothetical protein